MQKPSTYCEYVLPLEADNLHRLYHDEQYGFPLHDDNEFFCRLMMEINQAGLNGTIILQREPAFRKAFHQYDIDRVASYKQKDIDRLLADASIIRNRLKIQAAVENARRLRSIIEEHGSFKAWLRLHHPQPLEAWTRTFKSTFVFTGPEIVREFLVSTGYLPGAHAATCPVYKRIAGLRPPWLEAQRHPAGKRRHR